MSDNLAVWNALARPPESALKTIKGGRLSGKSDINPQWRYEAMTEQFGMCGDGWKFTVDRLWTEKVEGGEVLAFAQVSVYVAVDASWSDPIPGIGGSKLVAKEGGGLHNNDEAFKMATTDALGTALKMLGVAAEVYRGNFDGTKYKEPPPEQAKRQREEHDQQQKAAVSKDDKMRRLAEEHAKGLEQQAEQGTDALASFWKAMPNQIRKAVLDLKGGTWWSNLKDQAAKVEPCQKSV